MSKISIIIPCYNEEESLDSLHARLSGVIGAWPEDVEIVFVDDGSRDGTWEKMKHFHELDGRWKAVRLSRNFGHQAAVSAGLDSASGDAVIVIDGDLQDPPEILHRFIEKWREGYEVVYAVRKKRKESFIKRFFYNLFYRILFVITDKRIPRESGDFGLMDRRVVDLIKNMPEHNRFIRGLRAWVGFRQIGLEYERDKRHAGETHYPLRKLVKLAVDGIFSFSFAPLRMVTWLGLTITAASFLGVIFILLQRIFVSQFAWIGLAPLHGFAPVAISILFMGGVQLICLGIIGEYVARIYDETKNRPSWIGSERLGLPAAKNTGISEKE
jgi:polyisoprenyl-phosphate glycosyltransferase